MKASPHLEREAEAVRYVELLEMTIEQTAKAVRRPPSTVAAQHVRGMANLKELANEAEEAAPEGVRGRSLQRASGEIAHRRRG